MNKITEIVVKAVESRNFQELKAILDSSPSVWERLDADDYLLLHQLSEIGWSEGLRLALTYREGKERLNVFDSFSWTPLIQATKSNNWDSVKTLLDCGADVNAHEEVKIGNTALIEAVDIGSIEIVDLLLENGADPTIAGWMGLNALQKAHRRVQKSSDPTNEQILRSVSSSLRKPPGK